MSVMQGNYGAGLEALTTAIDALQAAIDAEADQEDISVMLTCQAKLQGLLAKDQAEADRSLSGGKVSQSAMRKMASRIVNRGS